MIYWSKNFGQTMYRLGKIKMTFILYNFICLELQSIRGALYKWQKLGNAFFTF